MYYVYFLKSKKYNETYIGSTNDLKRRLLEHNNGMEISTKRYMPWQLIYYEAYKSEEDAREREMKLKYHGNTVRELKKRTIRSLKNGAGFTLIELLVVTAIIVLLTALILPNYRTGDQQLALQRSSYKLAQDLRRAEELALSSQTFGDQTPQGYGISFDKKNQPGQYILFADFGEYWGMVEEITLEKPVAIGELSPSTAWDALTIVFTPPDPSVSFNPDADVASIALTANGTAITIQVNKAGLISVE